MDECGVDQYLYREYAYAPRGQKVVAEISGEKFKRTNFCAGICLGKCRTPTGTARRSPKRGTDRCLLSWYRLVVFTDEQTTTIYQNVLFGVLRNVSILGVDT